MATEIVRTYIAIPGELIESIDREVGRRGRSRFLAEAAEKELKRRRLAVSARTAAGSLAGSDTPPEWETSEGAAEWVRTSRRADDARLKALLDGAPGVAQRTTGALKNELPALSPEEEHAAAEEAIAEEAESLGRR